MVRGAVESFHPLPLPFSLSAGVIVESDGRSWSDLAARSDWRVKKRLGEDNNKIFHHSNDESTRARGGVCVCKCWSRTHMRWRVFCLFLMVCKTRAVHDRGRVTRRYTARQWQQNSNRKRNELIRPNRERKFAQLFAKLHDRKNGKKRKHLSTINREI